MNSKLENGWPDVTYGDDPNEIYEVKRGSDRVGPIQRQRHDWFRRVFGVSVKIVYFPKTGQKTYLVFADYPAFEGWLKSKPGVSYLYKGRDNANKFPECKAENKRGAVREILDSDAAQSHPEIVNLLMPTSINTDPARIRRGGPSEQIRKKQHGIYHTLLNVPGKAEKRLADKLRKALAPYQSWGTVTK